MGLNYSVHLFLKEALCYTCYLMNTNHLLDEDNLTLSYVLSNVTGLLTFSHLFYNFSNYFSQRTNITTLYIREKGNSQYFVYLLAIRTL